MNPDGKPAEEEGRCGVGEGEAIQSKLCLYDRKCLPMILKLENEFFMEMDSDGKTGKLMSERI